MDKNKIEELFQYLDSINPNTLQTIFKNNNFIISEKFIPLIKYINILKQTDISISELFYNRMKNQITNELLNPIKIKNYLDSILMIKKNQQQLQVIYNGINRKDQIMEFFEKLLKHFTLYSMDVDSSLIGLGLNDSTIKDLSNDVGLLKSNKNKEILQQILKEDEFIKKLGNWNSIEDPNELVKEIRTLTSQFRSIDKMKQGDLIAVRMPISTTSYKTPKSIISKIKNVAIVPNRYSSSNKKEKRPIPIITLDEYYNKYIKYIPKESETSLSLSSSSSIPEPPSSKTSTSINENTIQSLSVRSALIYGTSGNQKETSHGQNGIGNNYQPKAQFARFTGEKIENHYLCYFSAKENEAVAVPIENILLLNNGISSRIKENNKVHSMLYQPSFNFVKELMLKGKEFAIQFLDDMNVDLRFIQMESGCDPKINNGRPNLLVYDKIKTMKSIVEILLIDETHPFYSMLDKEIIKVMNEFFDKLKEQQYYIPSLRETIGDISKDLATADAKRKLNQISGEIVTAIDRFNSEINEYLKLNRKEEIQEWWSKLIETKCNKFLEKRNFNLNYYIDNNIDVIIENFKLIKFIINHIHHKDSIQSNPQYSPERLIEELKNEIYKEIDEYIKKCKVVFSDLLRINEPITSLDQIKQSLEDQKQSHILLYENLQELFSDLEYLEKMKKFEDEPDNTQFHIVPVSHLIVNHFLVLARDLQNNIEVYSPDEAQSIIDSTNPLLKQQLQESSTSPIKVIIDDSFVDLSLDDNYIKNNNNNNNNNNYNNNNNNEHIIEDSQLFKSIKSNDYNKVKEIVEDLIENVDDDRISFIINEYDYNGWSPLHFACSIDNQDICSLLLNVPGINVTSKTKEGVSVLHLLAKHPFNEKRREIYDKILSKGLDINVCNKFGETPLHSASLRGTVETVKYLLERGANVHAITPDHKETSLHYAVTRGSLEIVCVLLQKGAKPNIYSTTRGTPLDIAKNLKFDEIVQKLESTK